MGGGCVPKSVPGIDPTLPEQAVVIETSTLARRGNFYLVTAIGGTCANADDTAARHAIAGQHGTDQHHLDAAHRRRFVHRFGFDSRALIAAHGAHQIERLNAWRRDRNGWHGYRRPTTPFLDDLAAGAVVFDNAWSPATQTRPAAAAYMTGLMASATGVIDFLDHLDTNYVTVAELLRRAGWHTASFVQNGNAGPMAGLHQGFAFVADTRTMGRDTAMLSHADLRDWLKRHRGRDTFTYVHLLDQHRAMA